MCVAALTCAPALAARNHVFSKSFAGQGSGAGQLSGPSGVAIDEATGDVYVADAGNDRVEYFSSAGVYIGEFDGSAAPTGQFSTPTYIAIDNDASSPSYRDVYVVDSGHEVVDKFSASGSYLGQLTETSSGATFGDIIGIATDAAGQLWVEDSTTIDTFSAAVANEFQSSRGGQEFAGGYPWFAVDSNDNLYVKTYFYGVSKLNGSGEVLVSEFDSLLPKQYYSSEVPTGLAVELSSNSVYIDDADSEGLIGQLSPSGSLIAAFGYEHLTKGSGIAVDSNTGEVFVADPATGTVDTFALEPPAKPTVEAETSSNVSATSATLEGVVNPRGAATGYHFEYGPCVAPTTCASSPYEHVTPTPEGAIGSQFAEVPVHEHVQGLAGGTLYHFRVIAHNQYGIVVGPEQTITTQPAGAELQLLDDRSWEMVSPPNKQGSLILGIGQYSGEGSSIQAAADGSAMAFATSAPTEVEPQGYTNFAETLSRRGAQGGWSTQSVAPPHDKATGLAVGNGQQYRLFSSDLALAVVQPFGGFAPEISPEASEQTAFLHTNFTASDTNECASSCYRPLVTGKPGFANVPPGVQFSYAEEHANGKEGRCLRCGPQFAGATPDLSHIVLSSYVGLTSESTEGGLFEWAGGSLRRISVLPSGEPQEGGSLGNGQGNMNAISDGGERVVWSAEAGELRLYMRDMRKGGTVELDATQGGAGSSGGGQFVAASSDGSRVFFVDRERLTANSGANSEQNGGDLYECEMIEVASGLQCKLSDLTPLNANGSADVQGVIGASEDGSYVYFTADGALANGAPRGNCAGYFANAGQRCDLYVLHDGQTTLIARLSGEDRGSLAISEAQHVTARVSPNGDWLAFMSQQDLTGYSTRDAVTGRPDEEVYLYDAASDRLTCASCQPSGALPLGEEYGAGVSGDDKLGGGGDRIWESYTQLAASIPGWTPYKLDASVYQSRYLSNSGRLFFNSYDALAPQDVNGTWDVYEYEPPGVGTCAAAGPTFSERAGGCIDLVSSGASPEESAFLDASENGSDVFFLTAASLSPGDLDSSLDVYDAHECTEHAPCPTTTSSRPPCSSGDACKLAPTPQPALYGAPASETFSGAGNVVPVSKAPAVTLRSSTSRLAKTLKVCRRQRGRRRSRCEARARKRYGANKSKTGKGSSARGGR